MDERSLAGPVVVVTGPHGAGSTTVAGLLADRPRVRLVTSDRLVESGHRDGWLTPTMAAPDPVALLARAISFGALTALGQVSVLDGVGGTAGGLAQLAAARPADGTAGVHVVELDTADITLLTRIKPGSRWRVNDFSDRLRDDRHHRIPALRAASAQHQVPYLRIDATPAAAVCAAEAVRVLDGIIPPVASRPPAPRRPLGRST